MDTNIVELVQLLHEARDCKNIEEIRIKMGEARSMVEFLDPVSIRQLIISEEGYDSNFIRRVILEDIQQIVESRTKERAVYYINRFVKSITSQQFSKLNDIDLNKWKLYQDILTDSLWIFGKRDSSGDHNADYWGNFIPQIPNQLIRRYTKKGDVVVDGFLGSGTTLIECKKLGRSCIGIELSQKAADIAKEKNSPEDEDKKLFQEVVVGDSQSVDISRILSDHGKKDAKLIILHPPYWDIIKFSSAQNDLSNAADEESFLKMMENVVRNLSSHLERDRYLAVVIGDKYSAGSWIPLGFHTMDRITSLGFRLKSIVVKNFDRTRAKREEKDLWRYRALRGGFYVFKHEYIFIFQKSG